MKDVHNLMAITNWMLYLMAIKFESESRKRAGKSRLQEMLIKVTRMFCFQNVSTVMKMKDTCDQKLCINNIFIFGKLGISMHEEPLIFLGIIQWDINTKSI